MIPMIKTHDNQYTVIIDSKSYDFGPSHPSYFALKDCVRTSDEEDFVRIYDKGAEIEDFSHGHIKVKEGVLFYKKDQCHNNITERVLEMIRDGFDYLPMFNFIERLYKNPSNRAINEGFTFLMNKGLPITNDGLVLGYKGVAVHRGPDFEDVAGNVVTDGDYIDAWTKKTHRYNPGDVAEMPRRKVCDDPTISCAAGLHVGSPRFSTWAEKPVIVAFDPADIVSVPKADCEKMRCCKYTILSDYESDFDKVVVDTYIEPEEEDYEYYECPCGSGEEENDCMDCMEEDDDFEETDWRG